MSPLQGSYLTFAVLVLATYWFAVGCSDTTTAAPSLPPPSVSVIEVTSEDLPIYSEYAAQTFARDMVEVRGRVAAYDAFILRARKESCNTPELETESIPPDHHEPPTGSDDC